MLEDGSRRNVAFIISRKGFDSNAQKASLGCLKESGKLIISLDDDDLIKMIYMKENGEEPSDHSYPYIASLTREPSLFYEMRTTAKLMSKGTSDDAVVKEIVEQNLFQYPTEKSITRMAKACIKRLYALAGTE